MEPMIRAGKLEVVNVNPALPKTEYLAMYKGEQCSTVVSSIVMLAQESCDFTKMFDTTPAARP